MIGIIIGVLLLGLSFGVLISLAIKAEKYNGEGIACLVFGFVVLALFSVIVTLPVTIISTAMTGGIKPNYETQVKEGYMTGISTNSGLIWKTNECKLRVDNRSLNDDTFYFSVPTSQQDLVNVLSQNYNRKIRITTKDWFIAPYSIGKTDSELIKVEIVDENDGLEQ